MSLDTTKLILGAGAGAAAIGLLLTVAIDPTAGDRKRLESVSAAVKTAPRLAVSAPSAQGTGLAPELVQKPIFAMTTGVGAYTQKTFQLFGVAISPRRKAALVSIDGAPPVWVATGQLVGDVQLIDVDGRHARFDTPLGEHTVGLNDPAPAPAAPAGG